MTENTEKEQKPEHWFKPGQSGNPAGKPKGARNKTTLAVEALLNGEAENLTRRAIEMAMAGDGPALRLCLDKLVPARKGSTYFFIDMPKLEKAQDALKACTAIVEAVACGDLTPSEADELSRVVANFIKVARSVDLTERIKRLEQMAENGSAARLQTRLNA